MNRLQTGFWALTWLAVAAVAPTCRLLRARLFVCALTWLAVAAIAPAADWPQFRGPGGNARSDDAGPPLTWSDKENILWKAALPGPGGSSPITVGDAIFVTCYSGYGEAVQNPGQQSDLKRHLVCLDRKSGEMRWTKEVKVELPESQYRGPNETKHGYAASTPASDGERIYVFFGKSGVHCFDLKGNEVWMKSVGTGTHGWGCGTSPLLYKNLVIVNASVESGAIVALDKLTGKEEWKISGIKSAWSSPALVNLLDGQSEMVMNLPGKPGKIAGYDLANGKELWYCAGVPDGYICPSPISHKGIVYVIGGRQNTAVGVKAGGRGEVEPLWTTKAGSNVASPVFHEGHLYWLHEQNSTAYCIDAATGKQVYAEKIKGADLTYASGVLAGGKIYYVNRANTTFVVAAKPKFELLATNKMDDTSRTNASPAVDGERLLIRTDKQLYCVGKK